MKKQLLLGSALLAAISVYPQTGRIKAKPSGIADMSKKIAHKFAIEPATSTGSNFKQPIGPVDNSNNNSGSESVSAVAAPIAAMNWKLLCGSANIYGMLVSQSRPLQYNDNVNAVSFVHRKSATYAETPAIPATAEAGVIVAEISTNWGTTFDSTCIYSNGTDWGRYPQGAIYSAPGNTSIANAYFVGCGPTVAGSTWTGNFYASKKLNTFNSTADATPGAQQVISMQTATFAPNLGQHGWSRQGFSATDNGFVRSLGLIQDDNQGLSTMRGASVVKGTFNSGTFVWTTDSIIPAALVKPSTGAKYIQPAPQMAWNESGTVGYVVFIGCLNNATLSNKGNQPIIWKTTNGGTSWAAVPGIDFNSAAMTPLTDHLATVGGLHPTVASPYFDSFDITVDANDKLHIGATFLSENSIDSDSLNFISQFTMSIESGANKYNWGHTPGNRPYLYDFIGDGTAAWKAITVDSLSSEAVGVSSGDDGFNDNPWDPTGTSGSKTDNIDSRIQLGRTPDGQFVTYSWSESDTNFTTVFRKYNSIPNIKTRCMAIGSGTNMYQVSPTEWNATKLTAGVSGNPNASVANRATLHYMSPTTGPIVLTATTSAGYTVEINTPLTITNSNPYSQLTNNTTWYQNGKMAYAFTGTPPTATVSGIHTNAANSANNSIIYPNPASNNAVLAIDLKDNSNVNVMVMNAIGQLVKTTTAQGQIGSNNINIDLNGLSNGIYMVNIKVGNASSTKKLIVQNN